MVEYLIERQNEEKITDLEFATKLGVSRSMWQAIRTRRRKMGINTVFSALKAYPELVNFLPVKMTVDNSKLTVAIS